MAENRSDDPEIRPWNQTRPFFHAPCREQTVRVDADHRCGSLDAGEGSFDTASPTPCVVSVQDIAQRPVGIGIVALGQFLSLIPFIGSGTGGHDSVRIRFGLCLHKAVITSVRNQSLGSGAHQAFLASIQRIGPTEGLIGLQSHPLRFTGSRQPGRDPDISCNQSRLADHIRLGDKPF